MAIYFISISGVLLFSFLFLGIIFVPSSLFISERKSRIRLLNFSFFPTAVFFLILNYLRIWLRQGLDAEAIFSCGWAAFIVSSFIFISLYFKGKMSSTKAEAERTVLILLLIVSTIIPFFIHLCCL